MLTPSIALLCIAESREVATCCIQSFKNVKEKVEEKTKDLEVKFVRNRLQKPGSFTSRTCPLSVHHLPSIDKFVRASASLNRPNGEYGSLASKGPSCWDDVSSDVDLETLVFEREAAIIIVLMAFRAPHSHEKSRMNVALLYNQCQEPLTVCRVQTSTLEPHAVNVLEIS